MGPGQMDTVDPTSLAVLRWRVDGLVPRLGQALLIAALFWLQTRSDLTVIWLAICITGSLIDFELSRRCLADLASRRLGLLNDISRFVSGTIYASVCFLLLIDKSGFALAAAMLSACAMTLNNVVMTSGSRRFALALITPSVIALVALPLAAWATHHPISLSGALILTVAAGAYCVFTAKLTRRMFTEGKALRHALEAAQSASRAKSSFLAVTSHEIRTPLNGVLGMAQAMANDELSDVQRDRVGVIRQAGEALLDILNDILDLSKIEAGKLQLEAAPFDLEVVAQSAFGAFSATALSKGLEYRLDFAPSAHGVFDGDAARVRQVLCNLISNAVKFTAEGSVHVAVTATPLGVRIAVRDTGPGVPDGFAERLFEKFTQADASTTRHYGGTGLGLAICRELCESMGGCITIENGPSQGANFIVDLPLPHSVANAPVRAAEPASICLRGDDAPLRVLAAEDNPVNQLVLKTLLSQIGVEATVVGDGYEATLAWEEDTFDLILMDVQMPRMDGLEATRTIRRREVETSRPRAAIIALTANVMSHQVETYMAAGMDAFVGKPIVIAELYGAIAQCVLEREADAEDALEVA